MRLLVKAVMIGVVVILMVTMCLTTASAQGAAAPTEMHTASSSTQAPPAQGQITQPQEQPGTAAPAAQAPPSAPAASAPVPSQPQSPTAPETQSLHIQVGRSVVINLQSRLRRILVSNQAVLETVTVTPTQLAVSAKAPGSSSLVIWDETGHARILDVYADVDVSGLREALAQSFVNEQIQVEADQSRIILGGRVSNKTVSDEAVKLASTYSKEIVNSLVVAPAPRVKQIMLKVRFAEVNRASLAQLGVNFLSTGAANTIGTVSTQQFGGFGPQQINDITTVHPDPRPDVVTPIVGPGKTGFSTQQTINDVLNLFIFRPDIHLGAVVKALQQKNVLEILAEPNLMARSGEPAKFLAGGEFPFPVLQSGGTTNAITIQFRPFGVRLDFTGTVTEDNIVRLKVAPEVSALDFANALTISGFTIPAISTRRAETEIELKDGQSFGIAGLLDQRTTAQMARIPGIGDLPILGHLFRSKQMNKANTELLVLVTPVIVDPVGATVAPPKEPTMPIEQLDPKNFDRGVAKPSATPKESK